MVCADVFARCLPHNPCIDLTVSSPQYTPSVAYVSFASFPYAGSHTFQAQAGFGDYSNAVAVEQGMRMGKKRPQPGGGNYYRPHGTVVASVRGTAHGAYGKKDNTAPSAATLAWYDGAGKGDVADAFFDRQARLARTARRLRAAFRAAAQMAAPFVDSDDEDDDDDGGDDEDADDDGGEVDGYSDDEGDGGGAAGEPQHLPEAATPSSVATKAVSAASPSPLDCNDAAVGPNADAGAGGTLMCGVPDTAGVGGYEGQGGEGEGEKKKRPCEQYVNAMVTTNGVGQSAAGLSGQRCNGEIINMRLIQMAVTEGNVEPWRGKYIYSQLFSTWSASNATGETSTFLMGASGDGAENEDTDEEDTNDSGHDSENEPVLPVNGLVDEGAYVNEKRRQSNCYEMKCLLMYNVCNYVWGVEPPRIE